MLVSSTEGTKGQSPVVCDVQPGSGTKSSENLESAKTKQNKTKIKKQSNSNKNWCVLLNVVELTELHSSCVVTDGESVRAS